MKQGHLLGDATGASPEWAVDELTARYAAYRRRHAARLMSMIPRGGIRPLYRRARRSLADGPVDDPLNALVSFCETLMPLPPFDVWAQDLASHPDEHLGDLDGSVHGPCAEAPSSIARRHFRWHGVRWMATLAAFREESAWRGYIAFQEDDADRVHRTAVIFREDGPEELRERFSGFEEAALGAFLRSALP